MSQVSGSLITRNYSNFRGVDFTDNEVSLNRSPDSLNMWKDYSKLGKCIETRPEIELVATYDNTIFGLFFYKVGNTEMQIVHSGTKLYKVVGDTKEELFTGMMPARSNAFVYNQILYIKDGINYLKFDGETIGQVVGYIPTTSIARKPAGGGSIYQDVNMLSAWRKNTFLGDGESTEYYLDAKEIDGEAPVVLVNGNTLTPLTDYDYDTTEGKVTFKAAPPKPLTDGQDNVIITFKKTVIGYADRINKCTLLSVFDNRVFFSGNQDYPNTVWHSSLNDPTYCSDLDYYNEGLDLSPVRSMVAGNNALWVFKEPSQANTTVFYHNPVIDADYGKIYPSVHSSIATGCIGAGINFNDDIAFFSDRGMEAINGDVTTEQVIAHRSSMVDSRLLRETNYKDMLLEEWNGYLLVIIDNKVYLADSRAMYQNENHMEYEWFYWELDKNITCTKVKDGVLYIGTADGIYKFGVTDEYTEVTFDSTGSLYGVSTQNGIPSPDNKVELVNTYKAGKYQTTINGTTYRFTLDDDLRSIGNVKDKLYIDDSGLHLIKKVGSTLLNEKRNYTAAASYFSFRPDNVLVSSKVISDYFAYGSSISAGIWVGTGSVAINFWNDIDTEEEFKAWLSEHNTTVYYLLSETPVTDLNYTVSPISYWATPLDKFNYPQYMKTSNKKGCVTEAEGELIKVYAKTNKTDWELIDSYSNVTDAFVSRIKRKKFKDMQLKFYSTKPFSLYSTTFEVYVGGYLKRI
jgi:hypothetical protein